MAAAAAQPAALAELRQVNACVKTVWSTFCSCSAEVRIRIGGMAMPARPGAHATLRSVLAALARSAARGRGVRLSDVAGLRQRAGEPVELGHNEGVPLATGGQGFPKPAVSGSCR